MKIVMVADDSPVIRKVARRLLEDMNFVVVEAQSGDEVLAACRTNMPDAVILDWDMPGAKSLEVIHEIIRMPGGDVCKILFCTSEMLVPEMTRAKRSGAHGFLMKPFNRKILAFKFSEINVGSAAGRAA